MSGADTGQPHGLMADALGKSCRQKPRKLCSRDLGDSETLQRRRAHAMVQSTALPLHGAFVQENCRGVGHHPHP